MQYKFNKITDADVLSPLKTDWQKSLTAPQDGMWEVFREYADQWKITCGDKTVGYACVNDENCLLQFYLVPNSMKDGVSVFEQFIEQEKIQNGLVGTNNPIFLSLALHAQQKINIHTYLFTDFLDLNTGEKEGTLKTAKDEDLERITEFCHIAMGAPKEWLSGYLGNLISRVELFSFENNGEFLGTCEVRKSDTSPDIADVGMVVSPDHRRKGMGTFLLGKAKEKARELNRKAICSCEKDNIGSLKSIQNNGFRSINQLLSVEFKTNGV